VAFRDDRPPPSLPIGVRAEPRITVLGTWSDLLGDVTRCRRLVV
jgi:hypothetical protein